MRRGRLTKSEKFLNGPTIKRGRGEGRRRREEERGGGEGRRRGKEERGGVHFCQF